MFYRELQKSVWRYAAFSLQVAFVLLFASTVYVAVEVVFRYYLFCRLTSFKSVVPFFIPALIALGAGFWACWTLFWDMLRRLNEQYKDGKRRRRDLSAHLKLRTTK
jgi:hypothetical protein